jgi:hypothetical protein
VTPKVTLQMRQLDLLTRVGIGSDGIRFEILPLLNMVPPFLSDGDTESDPPIPSATHLKRKLFVLTV